ncbi:phosphatase PAP2 family protein [Georgenia halophila]|uniref:phosphatase PAP2 family protein n=1 Tax=Georgenia halophila TaxID=620889 RepID=UPI0031EA6671
MTQDARGANRRIAGVVLAVVAAAAVLAVWWFFVTTPTGQRLDEVAYEGSRIGRSRLDSTAQQVLAVVSVPFLVLVIAVAGGLALLRRRWRHAVAVAVVVAGANLSTQILKYDLLDRPDHGISETVDNSMPSGHTTVAATVAAAALIVAPPRWRWLAALLGAVYAGGTGVATMIGGWHRASDVVAAVLVVAAWLLVALVVLGPGADDTGRVAPQWVRRADTATRAFLLVVGIGAGLAALLSMLITTQGDGGARLERLIAYGGASVGVVAVTCLTAVVALWLAAPRPRSAPPARR